MIYLDSNATTQLDPAALEAMLPFLREHYANPSASYASSGIVRKALQSAREELADLLGASPGEILFTSGGTESNNAAIRSAQMLWPKRKHLVIASTEHSAVIEPARRWEAEGGEVTRVPVDRQGLVNLDTLRHALRPDQTALVSIMWANNETGTIAPMAEIADIAHAAGALLHTDAVQAVGKLSINLQQTPIDYLSLSGHKFHAPKGIGAVFVSRRARFRPFMLGGGQEEGRRSGTENVPAIVGLGKAASLMRQALHNGTEDKVKALRDAFEQHVFSSVAGVSVNGHPAHRLGTTASLCFSGINAQSMLIMLDQRGICCSAGSACHSANVHPSHVLEAMGYDAEYAASTLRFSFSRFNTMQEVEASVEAIASVAAKLRAMRDDGAGPVIVAS